MKWKTNWKKALRNGICVGTLLLFLFQFAAMAQEGGAAAQEEPSKISPLLLEAFAQQRGSLGHHAGLHRAHQ